MATELKANEARVLRNKLADKRAYAGLTDAEAVPAVLALEGRGLIRLGDDYCWRLTDAGRIAAATAWPPRALRGASLTHQGD